MPEIIRLDGLTAKDEGATYGLDAVPAIGTDAVRTSRRLWSLLTLDYAWENLRDEVASGTIYPPAPGLPRGRRAKVDVFWEVKGAGSDAPPEAAPLYKASRLPETDGTLMYDYGPITGGVASSCTIYCYSAGVLFRIVGCRGHFVWPLVVGEIAIHHFAMFGVMVTDPATVAMGTLVYDTNEGIAGVNTALTIGSWSPEWLSGQLDLSGVDPEMLVSGNANPNNPGFEGISSFDFAGNVDPRFSITARKVPLVNYNPYADVAARTSRTLGMTWGTVQYNRVKVVAAPLVLMSHGHEDGEGFANWNLNYRIISGGILRFD